ncbi:MAG: type II secretion system F family protein [Gemmatimonadales bacterium]
MRTSPWILLALTALSAAGATAQESARARAERTLPTPVFEELSALATSVEPSGIPEEPLFAKALEGAAKQVPPERLVPAVREYAGRLRVSRESLGADADVPLLVAGADALQRGVAPSALRGLPRDRPRSPMALLVLAELVESGVPVDRALDIVRDAMAQRSRDERMLDASARVRALIRQGVAPRDAVERVRAMLRNAGRAGPALPPGSEPVRPRGRQGR